MTLQKLKLNLSYTLVPTDVLVLSLFIPTYFNLEYIM